MKVTGTLRVPSDKSISHRALIFAALAEGESRVSRILESADVHSTAGVLRSLGVEIPELSDNFVVRGVGPRGLKAPEALLNAGNSGTTTRLMAGIVAASPFDGTFVGDDSLSRRPMGRIARPLEAMGAKVDLPPHGGLPMTVHGGNLHEIDWQSEAASAQIKSAILLAGLTSGVRASVTEPERSRDHTERMLRARGVAVRIEGTRVEIAAGSSIVPLNTTVPGDPSSAAFFAGLGAIANGGSLRLAGVCVNETRTGIFRKLREMGVSVVEENRRQEGGEWVANLVVSPGDLKGVTVVASEVPSMVDELPLLACVAALAEGETRITGANELRVKESDRITMVVGNLQHIGVDAEELPDGMVIRGNRKMLRGAIVTGGDHRLAMAFGILAAAEGNELAIDDRDCVSVSYPTFWADLDKAVTR